MEPGLDQSRRAFGLINSPSFEYLTNLSGLDKKYLLAGRYGIKLAKRT
jgi:hypothetical protein